MRKINFGLLIVVLISMSFTTLNSEKYTVVVDQSSLEWKGFKPTGEHFGTVAIASGNLTVSNEQIISGSFTMDMTSIAVLDTDKPKLLNHLKSSDFFEVTAYPTATFKIAGSSIVNDKNLIKGYLTIKGITKEISFLAKVSRNKLGQLVLESDTFKINRADYNVKYKSKTFYANLKDKFIYDEFEIKVKVVSANN